MGKAEEKYKYALNKDKYDPEVQQAVGKKSLSEKDANTVNEIQEMMRAEKEASVASRGKKPGKTDPGWALDPKTKLELKRRKKSRELPSKFGGRTIVTSENLNDFIAEKLKLNKD